MELAKKHWLAITNPGQANPYAWTWFPIGKGNPFSY